MLLISDCWEGCLLACPKETHSFPVFCWGEASTSSHHGWLKHLCVKSVLSWARGCGCSASDPSPTLALDAAFLGVPGVNGALEQVRHFVSKSEGTQEHV